MINTVLDDDIQEQAHFVIVPSMSDTTTQSVASQRKILAVQAVAPEADRENVIEFIPGLRSSCFCEKLRHSILLS